LETVSAGSRLLGAPPPLHAVLLARTRLTASRPLRGDPSLTQSSWVGFFFWGGGFGWGGGGFFFFCTRFPPRVRSPFFFPSKAFFSEAAVLPGSKVALSIPTPLGLPPFLELFFSPPFHKNQLFITFHLVPSAPPP